eukprot:364282-Chlamydomonas_euryale.AAC.13
MDPRNAQNEATASHLARKLRGRRGTRQARSRQANEAAKRGMGGVIACHVHIHVLACQPSLPALMLSHPKLTGSWVRLKSSSAQRGRARHGRSKCHLVVVGAVVANRKLPDAEAAGRDAERQQEELHERVKHCPPVAHVVGAERRHDLRDAAGLAWRLRQRRLPGRSRFVLLVAHERRGLRVVALGPAHGLLGTGVPLVERVVGKGAASSGVGWRVGARPRVGGALGLRRILAAREQLAGGPDCLGQHLQGQATQKKWEAAVEAPRDEEGSCR